MSYSGILLKLLLPTPRNFFFKDFIYFIHERHGKRQRHRQREKQALCGEPDAQLDPRTLGSHPELKADA